MAETPFWLEIIQAASYAGSAAAAGVAALKYVSDRNIARGSDERTAKAKSEEIEARTRANAVAEMELEWRRVQAAQALMQSMDDDPLASDAMRMLDWDGRLYPSASPAHTHQWSLTREETRTALRVRGPGFSDAEIYVRDAFDRFFMYWERAQHGVRIGLIKIEHIEFPLLYWGSKIDQHRDVFELYLRSYGFFGTLDLLSSLERKGWPPLNLEYEFQS